ncbi:Armadillo-type fold [Arabidopsis thaliana x Arabidopsis arenosa]|uniref:Armadillo-type fold n=1 Tax=Arabidopsis thaliana x Arabidopsis arenosa TaxID=1240361 RepID=A0A8T1ZRH7_9BRAS|nr:Armadillo-type fold [Arabidopsis thaliana x Arabidopsis arenosa]
MANNGPNWDGLLKWSLSHSDGSSSSSRLSEEDRQWFMEAMQAHTIDSISRMKVISQIMKMPEQVLEAQGITPDDLEGMLDELQEHVESIDLANDLHSIGGLVPLLSYLVNSNAKIRAKSADVLTTVVQNNPRSQQLVMEANGFEPLLTNFIADPDIRVRTKALGAISSLIRNNQHGITAFRLANGYAGLRDALVSDTVRFQRKALNLIHYLLQESNSDCKIVRDLGFPRIMIHLASNQDFEVREFALRGLLELAREESDRNLDRADVNLRQLLEERTRSIIVMSDEDLCAAREERQLVDSLWTVCYDEPSHLRERGLVYLPSDDELAPDVVRDRFEPPLRAWAARRHDETSEPPVPLLLGPAP